MIHFSQNSVLHLCAESKFLADAIKQLYPDLEVISQDLSQVNSMFGVSVIESHEDKIILAQIKAFEQGIAKAIFIAPRTFDIPEIKSHNIYILAKPFKMSSLYKVLSFILKKEPLKFEDCLIDEQSKAIIVFDKSNIKEKIRLTNKEFEIVCFIASASGIVLKKDILLNVFGYNELSNTNTVEVHLHRLKQKLSKHINISKYIKE